MDSLLEGAFMQTEGGNLEQSSYLILIALLAILAALQLACWFTGHETDFIPYILAVVSILMGFFGGGQVFKPKLNN